MITKNEKIKWHKFYLNKLLIEHFFCTDNKRKNQCEKFINYHKNELLKLGTTI